MTVAGNTWVGFIGIVKIACNVILNIGKLKGYRNLLCPAPLFVSNVIIL